MKKFTAALLVSATALISPAQAELTGYFEEGAKSPLIHNVASNTVTKTALSLMSVVEKHANELALTTKQKAALVIWKENNGKHMKVLMLKTAALEKISAEKALKGEKKEAVLAKVEKANALRKEIAAKKLECRNNLHSILDKKQWTKLVAYYDDDKQKLADAKPSQGLGTN